MSALSRDSLWDDRYELAVSLSATEQAVNWCLDHRADLVVMDVMMKTGLDGLPAPAASWINRALNI